MTYDGYGADVSGIWPGGEDDGRTAIEAAGFGGLLDALMAASGAGQCLHGDVTGYHDPPERFEQVGLKPGQLRCLGFCGVLFDSAQAWAEALGAIANGPAGPGAIGR